MSNKTYDTLKVVALVLTPILAFLASLVNIWGIPYGEQIVATLTALDTLIGAVVVVANKAYKPQEEPAESEEQ
jgi:hypothetical protein